MKVKLIRKQDLIGAKGRGRNHLQLRVRTGTFTTRYRGTHFEYQQKSKSFPVVPIYPVESGYQLRCRLFDKQKYGLYRNVPVLCGDR